MATNLTLAKVAAVGGFLTVSAGMLFRWEIQRKVRKAEFYQRSITMLNNHAGAMDLLGPPVMAGNVDLGDTGKNFCDAHQAQFEVPVRGKKETGKLYLWAERPDVKRGWEISRLELSLNKDESRRLVLHRGATDDARQSEEMFSMNS